MTLSSVARTSQTVAQGPDLPSYEDRDSFAGAHGIVGQAPPVRRCKNKCGGNELGNGQARPWGRAGGVVGPTAG